MKRFKQYHKVLLFFVIIHITNSVFSSVPVFQHSSEKSNLSGQMIKNIVQDNNGLMWFGTSLGLYSFDGYDLNKIKFDSDDRDINVNIIYLDSKGNLWAGLKKFGLYKIINNKFLKFDFLIPEQELSVYDINEDSSGNFWVATNKGLKYISQDLDLSSKINDFFDVFKSKSITAVEIFNETIIIAHQDMFSILSLDDLKILYVELEDDSTIHDFHIDKNEQLWIGNTHGIKKFNLKNNRFVDLPLDNNNYRVFRIIEHNNNIILTTAGNGILTIDSINDNVTHYLHDKNNSGSIKENAIVSLFVSQEEVLWIGGFTKGISTLNLESLKFGYETNQSSSIFCMPENIILSGYKYNDDTVWLGTNNGFVKYSNSSECEFINFKDINPDDNEGVMSFVEFDNKIWMLTGIHLITYDKITKTLEFEDLDLHSSSFPIFLSHIPNQQSFIIGTYSGLFKYTPAIQKIELIKPINNKTEPIRYNSYFIENDTIYIATTIGLMSYANNELKDLKWLNDQLNSKDITSVLKKDKDFYIGVDKVGLFKVNETTMTEVLIEDKIEINGILLANDDLWLATNNGLKSINTINNNSHSYSEKDGTYNEHLYGNATFKDKDYLYFGGKNGLIKFDPKSIVLKDFNAEIMLTNFYLMNKKFIPSQLSDSGFALDKSINETSEIELGYKDYIIGFEFAALDYADSMRNQYAYRLKGLYDDWVYVDATERKATFTNLSPGDYTFQVKASNKDGAWSKNPKELKIIVHPAPWLSPWAFFIYFVVLILSIWAFIRYKTMASRKRAQHLEITVKERTQEVSLQKKMVESLLDHKNEVFANITHEFKTPLSLILGPTEQLVDEEDLTHHSDKLNMIQRNAKRLMLMVGQILKLSQAEIDKEVIRESQAVQPILTMLHESFKPLAHDKGIEITLNNDNEANVYATAECLEIVVGNLLSNALKFSNKGSKIVIGTELNDNQISISVKDSGTGIDKKDIDKVFKRFVRLDTHKSIQGTGIGLSVVKEITEANNGQVIVNSEWGKGSEFIVTFPLSDIAANEELSQVMVDQLVSNTENELTTEHNDQTINQQHSENRITVLIIEDNLDMQAHIGNVLKNRFNTLFADRGRKGIALALEEMPDIIICDVMMPEMDGYQVTRILRHDGRTSHIPIVLLTALNTTESRIKGWRENIDIYITKPFNATELNVQLDNILTIRKMLQRKTNNAILSNDPLDALELSEQDKKFIEKFKDVIGNYYSNEYFQKADLAAKMAVSERQLQRKMKALIDENPMDMLRDYRLEQAAIKLKQGHQVSICSDACGFSSVSYFGSCFKKKYGVTPKKYQDLK